MKVAGDEAVAQIGATSAENVATTQAKAQVDTANIGAEADKFIAGQGLLGTRYAADQRRAGVEDTNIANLMRKASKNQVTRDSWDAKRALQTDSLASAERIAEIGKRP